MPDLTPSVHVCNANKGPNEQVRPSQCVPAASRTRFCFTLMMGDFWFVVCIQINGFTTNLTQRGQASVTLQPDSGLFNSLGAGVVQLTV